MIIDRRRGLRISMGNYGERIEPSVRVALHHHDLGYTDEEWIEHVKEVGTLKASVELEDKVMSIISRDLGAEIQEALDLRDPDEPSFIEVAYDLNQEQEPKKSSSKKTAKKVVRRK